MVGVDEIAKNIYMIDDQLSFMPRWGSVYLINEEKKVLIDTGPTASVDTVLNGIKRAGVRPEDIRYIIVTHVHLDHAGGAGVLVRSMPEAQVVVHHKGARHLVNPERLVSSTVEARGPETMVDYGEVVPIDMGRVRPVFGGEVIELSQKQTLRFIDAPGHAPHVLCVYESLNNGLFVGDSVGIRIVRDSDEVLLLATPPPAFDPELCLSTLGRIRELKVRALYFAHFGVSSRVSDNLETAMDKLKTWGDIAAKAIKESGVSGVEAGLMAQGYAELQPLRVMGPLYNYLIRVLMPLNIAGFVRYYQGKYEAEFGEVE
jgi:glyoxylase-like metal-dependent hydrolase (beta-lactamase superfamily II)